MPAACAADGRVGHLGQILDRVGERKSSPADPLLQRFPGDELHDEEALLVGGFDIVDDGDVGMIESGSRFGLLDEPSSSIRIGDAIGAQELESHRPIEAGVSGLVHHTHPALAELFDDAVVRDLAADHPV